jgi:low affinity Fe/Cu permease
MATVADGQRDEGAVPEPEHGSRGTRTTRVVSRATALAGSAPAMMTAVLLTVMWLVGGLFVPGGYTSTAYQLPVSTVSSIVTFVMVFVIQSSQNRDTRALQTKIDAMADLLASIARDQDDNGRDDLLIRLAGLEDAPEKEIDRARAEVHRRAAEVARRRR